MRSTILFAALTLGGCGGTGGADGGTAGHDLSMPADMAVAGSDDMAPAGPCGRQKPPDGGACLVTVSGKVVDDHGAPLPNLTVTTCGPVCFYGASVADGSFTVKVGTWVVHDRWATVVHGRPDHASYYVPLPPLVSEQIVYPSPFVVPSLPASGPAIPADQMAHDIVAGDVELILAAGTKVSFDPEDVVLGDVGKELRPVTIADPKTLPFVDAKNPPLALYGFAPFESQYAPSAAFAFNNQTLGLPAGTAVDVLAQAGLYDPPPAGTLVKVASAHVSQDGKRIATDPGQGLTWQLRWLALARSK
jgi:hypothetical protein